MGSCSILAEESLLSREAILYSMPREGNYMKQDRKNIRWIKIIPFCKRVDGGFDSISFSPDSVIKITATIAEMEKNLRDKGDRQA